MAYSLTYTNIGGSLEVTGVEGTPDQISIPETYEGLPVTSIGNSAFYNCKSLTSIEIPNSVTSIGNNAFRNCKSLTSIEIPNSVTSIGNSAFFSCDSLTSVVIGNSVTTIGGSTFSNCTSLTSVVIPDSVTSIGKYAFSSCASLTSIEIPDSVTRIDDWAFSNCTSLTSVVIGDSVTSIGYEAFYYCSSLTSVVIGDSVTSIDDEAFRHCTSLIDVVFPDSDMTIGKYAFANCGLVSICLPQNLTTISDSMFSTCNSLKEIVIGKRVTEIQQNAFNISSLKLTIYYGGTQAEWTNIEKSVIGNSDFLVNSSIYYYRETQPSDEEKGNFWGWDGEEALQGFKISCDDANMIDSKYFKVTQDGRITAKEGQIGKWLLDENKLIFNSYSSIDEKGQLEIVPGMGMAATTDPDDPTFYAGFNDYDEETGNIYGSPWDEPEGRSWKDATVFYVKKDGTVALNEIETNVTCNKDLSVKGLASFNEIDTWSCWATHRMGISEKIYFDSDGSINGGSGTAIYFMPKVTPVNIIARLTHNADHNNFSVQLTGSAQADLTLSIRFKRIWGKTQTTTVTIKKGETSGTSDTYYAFWGIEYFEFADNGEQTITVTQSSSVTDSSKLITCEGNFVPLIGSSGGNYTLGTDTQKWSKGHFNLLYSDSGKVNISDRNKKNTINILSSDYELLFDQLRPVTFKYNNGTSDRLHTGFIAQEVRDAIIESGLTTKDFAAYCEWQEENDIQTYGLRYSEFIALCVDQIQKLKKRVAELENKLLIEKKENEDGTKTNNS